MAEVKNALNQVFPEIDFTRSLADQFDSLGQVQFLIELEKIVGHRVDTLRFDRIDATLDQSLTDYLK